MLQWFANLSFRRKIALPILLLAVLLLLVGALGVHGIAQLNESNQRLGKRFLPASPCCSTPTAISTRPSSPSAACSMAT